MQRLSTILRCSALLATLPILATLSTGATAQAINAGINAIYYPTQGKVVMPRVQLGNKLYYVMLESRGGQFVIQGASLTDLSLPAGFVPATKAEIVGTWKVSDEPTTVLTFNADGTYSMQHGPSDDPNCNKAGGAESGTYQYDASTGVLDAVATSDANGECGLSHPNYGPLRLRRSGADLIGLSHEGGKNEEVRLIK